MRCKFRLELIQRSRFGADEEVHGLTFVPVCDGSKENKEFFRATPAGEIRLGVANPAAVANMKLGAEYYVDFIEAPK